MNRMHVIAATALVLAGATSAATADGDANRTRTDSSCRSPGTIGAATRGGAGYGDANTEAAVMKVLWWLKETQRTDSSEPDIGYWSGGSSTLANTALAVLTYLGHGEYPGSPSPYEADFGPVVARGINYLVSSVQNGTDGKPHMKGADGNEYAFLFATYALCEAYGMTNDADTREAALVCLTRIVKGQSTTGGWDYKIDPKSNRDDVSFAGWALQALKAGKMAGLNPDGLDTCIKKAVACLQKRNFTGGGFNYVAANKNATGLTATGCLAMQLLGYGREKEVASALGYMRGWKPAWQGQDIDVKSPGSSAQYYCYYATQCKYQAGMKLGATQTDAKTWQDWNRAMKALYTVPVPEGEPGLHDVATPAMDHNGKAHKQGYYTNKDAHTSRPVMDTCLAALQLMVYYRYLPIPNQHYRTSPEPTPSPWSIKERRKQAQREQEERRKQAEAEQEARRKQAEAEQEKRRIEQERIAAFSLDRFMEVTFGEAMSGVVKSSTLKVIPSTDEQVISVSGRMHRPFRKFDAIRLFGFKEGSLYGVELLCPHQAFSTQELLEEECRKVVELLEKKYTIPFSDRRQLSNPSYRFSNDNIRINVWIDNSGIHLQVESLRVMAAEKDRQRRLEQAERDRLRRLKEERENKERVPDDEGADRL